MATEENYFKKILEFKKESYYAMGFGVVLVVFLLIFKGCSWSSSEIRFYTIGQDTSWHVLNTIGKDQNLTAFSDDLLLMIANQERIRMKIVNLQNASLIAHLHSGQVDGVISTLEPIKLSLEEYVYSEPYYLVGPVLIIPKNLTHTSWSDVNSKIVGVLGGSTSILELKKQAPFQLKLYDSPMKALNDLGNHSIDGVILSYFLASYYTKTFFPDLKIATTPLNNEGIRLIALKNEHGEELIRRFNEGLDNIRKSGAYEQLLHRWDLSNPGRVE